MFSEAWKVIDSILPLLLQGLWTTIKVSVVAIVAGSLLGVFLEPCEVCAGPCSPSSSGPTCTCSADRRS